jgi:hypothetical protein
MFESMLRIRKRAAGRGPAARIAFVCSVLLMTMAGCGLSADLDHRKAPRQYIQFKQILLGLLMHVNRHNHFPPRAIADSQGKPLLSWRVAILPFIDEQSLYNQFHLDEPWDSPNNKPLIAKMPSVFQDANRSSDGTTTYLAPYGKDLAWDDAHGMMKLPEFIDGISNTIMLVEADNAHAVPWTKPDDLEVNLSKPFDGLAVKWADRSFILGFADGHLICATRNTDPDTMKALFTRDGAEPIDDTKIR